LESSPPRKNGSFGPCPSRCDASGAPRKAMKKSEMKNTPPAIASLSRRSRRHASSQCPLALTREMASPASTSRGPKSASRTALPTDGLRELSVVPNWVTVGPPPRGRHVPQARRRSLLRHHRHGTRHPVVDDPARALAPTHLLQDEHEELGPDA